MHEWFYLAAGQVTHARERHGGGLSAIAVCGQGTRWWVGNDDWRGTGNQDEYDNARDLPKCKRCTKLLGAR